MKNQIFYYFSGYVKIEVKGRYTELFLDRCIQHGVPLWSVKRVDKATISCYIFLKDIPKIRVFLRRTGCRIRFKRRHGLPFLLRKLSSRKGFVIGLTFCLLLIFLLSNVVWSIRIEGASPELEKEVEKTLMKLGVKKGALIFFLPSEQEIQQSVTEEIEELTWIGVKRLGTQYSFQTVEKIFPEEKEKLRPRHLIAKKKAVIHKVFTEKGEAVVEERDYVRKGDVLISGLIGEEENEKAIPAKGEVFGEVWYLTKTAFPLESTIVTKTGNRESSYHLQVGTLTVPIWGFRKTDFRKKETLTAEKELYFFMWKLPFVLVKKEDLEVEHQVRHFNEKEAKKIALQLAEKDFLRSLPPEAEIKGKKILQEAVHNGKVNVTIHYQVIEDIAIAQPIIQGD